MSDELVRVFCGALTACVAATVGDVVNAVVGIVRVLLQ